MKDVDFKDLLEEGRDDLIDARQLAVGGDVAMTMAMYHIRQAAEKFINAFAIYKGIELDPNLGIKELWLSTGEENEDAGKILDRLIEKTGPENAEVLRDRVTDVVNLMRFVYEKMEIIPAEMPEVKKSVRNIRTKKTQRPKRNLRQQKRFFVCRDCGVNIPFTRHTSRGRVVCPQCGRLMRLIY